MKCGWGWGDNSGEKRKIEIHACVCIKDLWSTHKKGNQYYLSSRKGLGWLWGWEAGGCFRLFPLEPSEFCIMAFAMYQKNIQILKSLNQEAELAFRTSDSIWHVTGRLFLC